jgi:hypothetical protein
LETWNNSGTYRQEFTILTLSDWLALSINKRLM